jgi:hypothetical protein
VAIYTSTGFEIIGTPLGPREALRIEQKLDAEGAHQSLVDGLAKCDRAIDLMDSWFDTRDQGTKEAAVLLVAGCEEDVTAARNELATLAGGD